MYRLVVDPRNYTRWRWDRPGSYVRWIIVHDPGNDDAEPEDALHYLRTNLLKNCYHELLYEEGPEAVVNVLAPADQWTGHAGQTTRIPGTQIVERGVNYWTYGLSAQSYGKPLSPLLWAALVERLADLVGAFDLPDAGVILSHREITIPDRRGRKRRADIRSVDMERLRQGVAAVLAARRG